MASTYSLRFRLNYQAPGDNLNLWGVVLNTGVFQLLEDAIAKRLAFSLSGLKTLTTALGTSDEARSAFLDVTGGTGGTVTIPSVEKLYLVRNASSGLVSFTTGAGAVVELMPSTLTWIVCDGANVREIGYGGQGWKQYVDAVAWSYNAGNLPGQVGNAGHALFTDGTDASWRPIELTDVNGYELAQRQRMGIYGDMI